MLRLDVLLVSRHQPALVDMENVSRWFGGKWNDMPFTRGTSVCKFRAQAPLVRCVPWFDIYQTRAHGWKWKDVPFTRGTTAPLVRCIPWLD